MLSVLVATACVTPSAMQPPPEVSTLMWGWERHFALEWTVEPEKGDGRRLHGYIYNRHGEFALTVRVLARAVDGSGTIVGQRIEWVQGGVAGFSRAYFEVPHLPVAENYQVTVWEYTWLQSDGDMR